MNKKATLTAMAACAISLSGCAIFSSRSTNPKMSVSPLVPAAESSVRFGKATNGNTSIDLKVKHLANTEKLTPPSHIYVVWLRSNPNAQPQNIGALDVDENLTGTLQTITALHSFALFITAEGSGQVQQPTGPELLWTDYSHGD